MIRDKYSKALLETDTIELQKYRKAKKQDKDLEILKQEVLDLKQCVNSLKEKLKKIEAKV